MFTKPSYIHRENNCTKIICQITDFVQQLAWHFGQVQRNSINTHGTSCWIDSKALFLKTRKWRNRKLVIRELPFFIFYHKRFHTFSNFDPNKTDDTLVFYHKCFHTLSNFDSNKTDDTLVFYHKRFHTFSNFDSNKTDDTLVFYHKRFHTFSNFDSNKTDDTSVLRRNQPSWRGLFVDEDTDEKMSQ